MATAEAVKGTTVPSKSKKGKRALLAFLLFIIIGGLVAGGWYYYDKYQDSQKEVKKLSDPQEASKAQVQQVVDKVSQLTDLPMGETPTLATVVEPDKLKDQPFFANAQKGDQALIYTGAKKAFLYRPSTDKIINIAPVNIGPGQN
ncbi:TPA: hypothetical protein DIS56_02980 [Candidatus Saccharibacteria bacterium]|nr:MAG: hypothetical protein A3F05_04130 [Candidatus Saccharibacteria bacterium RIFCSPHIGHO2_12_FULL_47_17]HCM52070.1 hypothetical protein [Candidatus Saccharibacteria bacterium]